jgi:hypothetical protein
MKKQLTMETKITRIFTEDCSVFLCALRASVVKIKLR